MKVQEDDEGMKLKGTHQHKVCSDDDDDDDDVMLKTQALLITN